MSVLRVKFKKAGDIRYISHLDMMRLFHRSLRRAKIPIAYSQGFNPHPVISFATALSLGTESFGEYCDIKMEEDLSFELIQERLNSVLPGGIEILDGKYIADKEPSLMSIVEASSYRVIIYQRDFTEKMMNDYLESFMTEEELIIERKKKKKKRQRYPEFKEVNIKPLILSLEFEAIEDSRIVLNTTLITGSKGNLKPEDLVKCFESYIGISGFLRDHRIQRIDLFQNINAPKRNLLE